MATASVLLIYTGGTIGMAEDPRTGALRPVDFSHLMDTVPELQRFNLTIDFVSFEHPIDSSDATVADWQEIARLIQLNYQAYDGFVVLHGTDTMSYTASALSFMLHNLSKPVVITGSQLPVGKLRTDGKENLIASIEIAAARYKDLPMLNEVVICFESNLFRGNRTSKFNTEDFDAFLSPNYPALANIGTHIHYRRENMLQRPDGPFRLFPDMEASVAVLKLFPGISEKVVRSVIETEDLKGLLLETFGSGNGFTKPWFREALKAARERNLCMVNVTQCMKGFVEQGRYETSSYIQQYGVWSGGDMTFEAALTKLMFILASPGTEEDREFLFTSNLRGERTNYSAIV